MTMRFSLAAFALLSFPALAQDAGIQRELIRRDQQSDAFRLQLRQSQERLKVPSGDVRQRQEVEARQLGERQRLEAASERQLQDAAGDTPADLQPHERARMQRERQPLVEGLPPTAAVPPESPRPLPMTGDPAADDKGSPK